MKFKAMPRKAMPLALALFLLAGYSVSESQSDLQTESETTSSENSPRRVYEGVVDMKQKTIGTLILMDIAGSKVSGWIRLGKYLPIDGGSIADNVVEFRAAGNSYKIDDRKGRIVYSGPDGSADRQIYRLTPVTGRMQELTEGERFAGYDIASVDVNGRLRRFKLQDASLWKRQGPPFEKFERPEELLQRDVTLWVSDGDQAGAEIVEEPEGMDIPLKLPKKAKEKKK